MLVWVPAAIILATKGSWIKALVLVAFSSLVIGSIDNVMRPRLVGQDTEMSDLLILLSTLGGIAVCGAIGFIVGPIIAALFVTIWGIFGKAYATISTSNRHPRSGSALIETSRKPVCGPASVRQRLARDSRNAAISSPLRTRRTSPATSAGWFHVLLLSAGNRASSAN